MHAHPPVSLYGLYWGYLYLFFFDWLFIVALTAGCYRDCHFFVSEWYFIDILNLRSYSWDFSLSMADIYRAVSKVIFGHVWREQPWDQATPSIMPDIYRAVSKVFFTPRPTWQPWDQATPSIMTDIYRAVSKVVFTPRSTWQPWDQATPSIMTDIYRAVSKVVFRPGPTWQPWDQATPSIMRHLSGRVWSSFQARSDVNNHEIRQPHLRATIWVQITLASVWGTEAL